MANPTLLTMPLCVNADKNTIPPTDAGTSGLFSEEYGWQEINSLPLSAGGKAPNRRDFNGVFALLGGIAYACQRGYTFEWDATQDYEVGCVVLDSTDGKRYECIADVSANATPPSADSTNWKIFDLSNYADTDLSNLTPQGEQKIVNSYLVSYEYDSDTGAWYREYSDGWVEQGGKTTDGATIVFSKPFANTDYYSSSVIMTSATGSVGQTNRTTTGIRFTNTAGAEMCWICMGMGASV